MAWPLLRYSLLLLLLLSTQWTRDVKWEVVRAVYGGVTSDNVFALKEERGDRGALGRGRKRISSYLTLEVQACLLPEHLHLGQMGPSLCRPYFPSNCTMPGFRTH